MEKYYTPGVEEFHVGFEFEIRGDAYKVSGHSKEWHPFTFGIMNANLLLIGKTEFYRVKFLDKEDIESLGFKHILGRYFMNCIINDEKEEIYLEESYPAGSHSICICNGLSFEDEISWFRGIIKNKSELKTIMKQIGIL